MNLSAPPLLHGVQESVGVSFRKGAEVTPPSSHQDVPRIWHIILERPQACVRTGSGNALRWKRKDTRNKNMF